jgi:prepilin-type N-terminal cleavage/methylation domain-containing protein
MKKRAFTLIELLIVVTIIALTAVFSFKAWNANLVKSEFDNAVNEIVGVFQDGRAYALKNAVIDGAENSVFTISYDPENEIITLSGDGVPDPIAEYTWIDILSFNYAEWSVTYTAPYADFAVVDVGGDLELTLTSLKGDLSDTVIVHEISGIAEIE